ncbi:MAG: PQQ-dependent sugar dehydrogenase [Comamonas sp.]
MHKHWPKWYYALGSLAAALALCPPAQARGYTPRGECGGFERVAITSPAGTCVALVADERDGLRAPRRVLEIEPGRLWIMDMGSWMPRQGRLLELTMPPTGGSAQRPKITTLADKLDRPLGLVRGPDGHIYIGETDHIWRTPIPARGQAIQPETVLDKLPNDGAHPLKELAFGLDGSLFVNMGAVTDRCQSTQGALPSPCAEREAPQFRGAVWRAVLNQSPTANQPLTQQFAPYALGLRNSVALATLPDGPAAGSLWQGENNIDYRDKAEPPEELNELIAGADYGWPYCVGNQRAASGYEGQTPCQATRAPHLLWPAHSAPLHLLATPLNSPFHGQLLVAWHGPQGHRVVGFARQKNGKPGGKPIAWLSGWTAQAGVRPLGRPTGLAINHQGHLLVVEDYNRSLLMLLPDLANTAKH